MPRTSSTHPRAAAIGSTSSAARRASARDVDLVGPDRVARVLQPAEGEQVADQTVEVRGLGLGAVEVARVAHAALERLERAAQREQRRAQVVGDGGDHEAALVLGGGRGAQRVAQPACHAVQRVADLRDLASAGGQRRDVELPAGDALGVGGEPRQRLQHPAPEEHDDDGERGAERGQAGAQRDRPARGRALAGHPQHARDAPHADRRLAVALRLRLDVGALESRRQHLGFAGERDLGRNFGRGLDVGHGTPELGPDPECGQTTRDRVALVGGVQLGRAQHRDGLVAAVALAPRLPPARRGPRGQPCQRGHRDREGEREPEPDVQRQRAAHQPAAGGSKR